jgi:hypothetical protein
LTALKNASKTEALQLFAVISKIAYGKRVSMTFKNWMKAGK